jgi:hypothetical protein
MKSSLLLRFVLVGTLLALAGCASTETVTVAADPSLPPTTMSCLELSLTDLPGCTTDAGLPTIDPNSIHEVTDDQPAVYDTSFTVRGDETFYDGPNVLDPTTTSSVVTTTSTSTTMATTSTTLPVTTSSSTTTAVPTTVVPTTVVPTCVFGGFFAPVDNSPMINRVKAGSAVPVKFTFCSSGVLGIFASGSPVSVLHPCGAGAIDDVEQTVTAGSSALSFDPASGRYNYVWKTDKMWTGQCRTLKLTFANQMSVVAEFRFT